MVQIIKNGKVVMKSKDLAAILRYQRKPGIYIEHYRQSGKTLHITFSDGATCTTRFADARVLSGWIKNRQKYGIFPE